MKRLLSTMTRIDGAEKTQIDTTPQNLNELNKWEQLEYGLWSINAQVKEMQKLAEEIWEDIKSGKAFNPRGFYDN